MKPHQKFKREGANQENSLSSDNENLANLIASAIIGMSCFAGAKLEHSYI